MLRCLIGRPGLFRASPLPTAPVPPLHSVCSRSRPLSLQDLHVGCFAAGQQGINHFHTSSDRKGMFEDKDKDTKALTVWTNLKEVKASPLPALTLGLSGLIPFVAAPFYIMNCGLYLPAIATAQLAYGATILSFLGGVRWGFTIPEENPVRPDWVNLCYSVTPPLIAWVGLLFPEPFSALTVMSGLVFAAYFDLAMFGYPAWFKGLRFILSFVAVLSLWTTLMCKYMLKERDELKKDENQA